MEDKRFNTGETQEELRSKYNPNGSTLRKAQLRMLEILDYVAGICETNGLTYWLSGGTLLGAFRHGGFIPWDDDLDIEMPKEDYLKLRRILLQNKDSRFQLQDHSTDSNYYYAYPKVRDTKSICTSTIDTDDKLWNMKGVWIDIFVLDRIPVPVQKFSWYAYSFGRRYLTVKKNPVFSLLQHLRYHFCYKALFPVLNAISQICKPDYLTVCLGSEYPDKRRLEEVCESTKLKFEHGEYSVPAGYEDILQRMYKFDYHLLPPPEQRGGHFMKIEFLD